MISTKSVPDLDACRNSCDNDMSCIGFTFGKGDKANNCMKYRELQGHDRDAQMESGYKYQSP